MSDQSLQIILGSNSPRRRELLAGLGVTFSAISIDADETYPAHLQAGDIPMYISRAKAHAYEPQLKENELLITADTIVWCDGRMLGKPHNEAEAFDMIRLLSGKTHQVYTAVTFAQKSRQNSAISFQNSAISRQTSDFSMETVVDKTDVTFAELSDEEIRFYVQQYKPFDKAGAYGIQEWIGYMGCTQLDGSYFNVMGFPTHLVYKELKKRGVNLK